MTTVYSADCVLPMSSSPIANGAIAVENDLIVGVGPRTSIKEKFPSSLVHEFGEAALLPGFANAHSHLELTALRGLLEPEERNFFAWLQKLTHARLERMSDDDLYVSAAWGACEAARAGVTCLGDASDSAYQSMRALRDTGLRGIVYQESFGPDPNLANENLATLQTKIAHLRELETPLVKVGISPHAPYTVCAAQLELISELAVNQHLPVMMHAAESEMEEMFMREGTGPFAQILASRGVEWKAPGVSTIQYLKDHELLKTRPLLAHCINVDSEDIETIFEHAATVAHCPKSNAKLGHGRAPFAAFIKHGVAIGLGSDSVASNNTCDMLEEARFALFSARVGISVKQEPEMLEAWDCLVAATSGGARALGLSNVVGELREGLQADFIVVSLSGRHQIPLYDPVNTLIFSSSGRDVVLTVVAGQEVYRCGQMTTVDENRLRVRIREIAGKLRYDDGCQDIHRPSGA